MSHQFVRVCRYALALGLALALLAPAVTSAQTAAWNEYPSAADGFAISAPSAPMISTQDYGTAEFPAPTHTWIWKIDGAVLLVAASAFTNGWGDSKSDPVEDVASGEIKNLKNGRITSKKPVTLADVSGIDYVLEGDDNHARSRIFRRGNRIWTLLVLSAAGTPFDDRADRFFASFRFTSPAPP